MNDDLATLIATLEPALLIAFLQAIGILRRGVDMLALQSALEARDVDAALDALNIEPAAFNEYLLERQSGFAKAGTATAEGLTKSRSVAFRAPRPPSLRGPRVPGVEPQPNPGGPSGPRTPPPTLSLDGPEPTNIIFRFDMTNPRAEAKIRTEAAARVTGYVEEQIETARRVIGDGFNRGEGPQTIAIDIAGRINPLSGRREGGIIGLSAPQVGYVESMRARLLSGNPDEMVKVIGRFDKDGKWVEGTGMTRRDRRFDKSIKKAIRDVAAGKSNPLTRDKIDEMAAKYSDRLLARRAEDIARTETAQGVLAARAEATKQALDKSGLADAALTKTWRHLGGLHHARDWHLVMNGKSVTGIDAVFFMPDGSLMKYAHDPDGGAKNNVACRCDTDFGIDWAHGL
jgi:hypothetical protein